MIYLFNTISESFQINFKKYFEIHLQFQTTLFILLLINIFMNIKSIFLIPYVVSEKLQDIIICRNSYCKSVSKTLINICEMLKNHHKETSLIMIAVLYS